MRLASLCKAAVTSKSRQKRKYSSLYGLTGKVVCGACGYEYRRGIWAKRGKKTIVWKCFNRLDKGVEKCEKSVTLKESALNRAVMESIHRITSNDKEFLGTFRQNVMQVIGAQGQTPELIEYEKEIQKKQDAMMALIAENARTSVYSQEFDEQYRLLSEEIKDLKAKKEKVKNVRIVTMQHDQRMKDIAAYLSTSSCQIPEFDNDLVRRLIATVKVESKEKLLIQFQSGIVLKQEVGEE